MARRNFHIISGNYYGSLMIFLGDIKFLTYLDLNITYKNRSVKNQMEHAVKLNHTQLLRNQNR